MVRLPDKGSDDKNGQQSAQAQPNVENPSLAALSAEAKDLVRLISTTDVSELHIENGQTRIIIKRGVGAATHTPHAAPAPSVYTPPATLLETPANSPVNLIGHSPTHGDQVALADGEQLLVAPMVGTFYRASSPTSDPFVREGESVEAGQPIGIIEAMKMMNEIEAEVGGIIQRILVENAQPVEYGQPLMVVRVES
jgi:acetyl-CoA carboxylase biotin carboxyl carrier protein